MGVVSAAFNLILLATLAFSVIVNTQDAELFSFGWTYRLSSRNLNMQHVQEQIAAKYLNNTDSSKIALGMMTDEILDLAHCKDAIYSTGLSWQASDASPTCNCLRNLHVEYIKAITPNGVGLNVTQMKNNDTNNKTQAVVRAINMKCFKAVRMTQIEDMSDPLDPDKKGTLHQTNILGNVLYWNVLGCITSLTILVLDSKKTQDGTMQAMVMDCSPMMLERVILAMAFFLGLLSGAISYGFVNPTYASGLTLIPFVFFVFCSYHMYYEADSYRKYPTRKRLVFWTQYILVLPFVVHCMHMLLQRRDVNLNWIVFWASVVVGMCSLGNELLQTYSEYADAGNEEIVKFRAKKNMIIRVVMMCIVILVLQAFLGTFPTFPWVPFSNMYSAMGVAAVIMVLPLISTGRYMGALSQVRLPFTCSD
jgi:hypothetical protein